LSQREGVTLFMTLLSVFKVLLYRYSGQEDIAVGTSIAGRRQQELEGLIGFFVNTLVLRSDLGGDPTVRELLGRVKGMLLEAYEHQDVPFERVVDGVVKERDQSRSPLFQVMFELINTPASPELEMGGLRFQMETSESNTSKFDMNVIITGTEPEYGASVFIEYCTDLYDESTIARMFSHYTALLKSALSNTGTRIRDLNMLEKTEETYLAGLNETTGKFAESRTLAELFDEQVQRSPEAIALLSGGVQTTYLDLYKQSNKIAHYLRTRGVGRGHYVAVNNTLRIGTIINIVGIIKAGAAYVQIDEGYSNDRKERLFEELNIAETLNAGLHESLTSQVPDDAGRQEWTGPNDIACAMYTSDASGTLKTIFQSHKLIADSILDINQKIKLQPDDRVMGMNNLASALSLYDIFGTLTGGASLIITENSENIGQLAHSIVNDAITILQTTPSVASRLLLKSGETFCSDRLRYVLLSGERLPIYLPDRIKERFPQAIIAALGRVMEGALWSTFFRIDAISPDWRNIPYGRPIGNQKVYVLEENLKQCPVNIPGELYLSGPGLIAECIQHEEFGFIYKSGRTGLVRKDGNLEFFEEQDGQEKIRGHRIEVPMIELYLSEVPGVRHATVVIKEDKEAIKHLSGYYIATKPINADLIQAYLRERLPEYMLPDFLIAIDDLPLTSDGRIDRSGLQDAERNALEDHSYGAPRNKIEEALHRIYAALLQRDEISINDNFFEIGGNSMYAVQIITNIFKEFKVELRLRDIFDFPTIESVSAIVEKKYRDKHFRIDSIGPSEYPELSHAQERLFVADKLSGGDNAAYNVPGSFVVGPTATREVIEDIFNRIIRRHDNLRTVFFEKDGVPYCKIYTDVFYQVEEIDLTGESNKEDVIAYHLSLNLHRNFDLSKWPLFGITCLRIDPSASMIIFSMHHIISDGWSMGLLEKEFAAHYDNYVPGQSAEMEPLTMQYRDYVVWHKKFLAGDAINPYKEYWMRILSDPAPAMNLFIDKPRPKRPTYRSTNLSFGVPAEAVAVLRGIGHTTGASLFMCLVAIIKIHLRKLTKQDDIIVGTPSSGRVHPDLEHLVGFFVNILPLRTRIDGDGSFADLVKDVRRTVLDAYDNQIYPFDKMVDDLLLTRDSSRNPLFDILVAYEDLPGEVKVGDAVYSKYDITIYLWAGTDLKVSISFNDELFDHSSMLLFRDGLKNLFDEVLLNDNRTVDQFGVDAGVSVTMETVDFDDDFEG
jgi:non-ribosomal peptide synthetase component F/acyl carrier protein